MVKKTNICLRTTSLCVCVYFTTLYTSITLAYCGIFCVTLFKRERPACTASRERPACTASRVTTKRLYFIYIPKKVYCFCVHLWVLPHTHLCILNLCHQDVETTTAPRLPICMKKWGETHTHNQRTKDVWVNCLSLDNNNDKLVGRVGDGFAKKVLFSHLKQK